MCDDIINIERFAVIYCIDMLPVIMLHKQNRKTVDRSKIRVSYMLSFGCLHEIKRTDSDSGDLEFHHFICVGISRKVALATFYFQVIYSIYLLPT